MINKGFAFLLSTALYTRLNFLAIAAKLVDEPEKLRDLFPAYPDHAITTARSSWDSARGLWQFSSGVLAASEWHPAGSGSNSWAIAPQRSTTGRAILCNDPHLRMSLPSVWYLMHLRADNGPAGPDGYEVWGASIPGVPCVQIGHNRFIAWGITAALCDDVEIYREKLHRLDPDLYRVGHRWQKLESRKELIAVEGRQAAGKNCPREPARSGHQRFPRDQRRQRNLNSALDGARTEPELNSLYSLNCARDWKQFQDSLRLHAAPSLNFVYADHEGNIGYTLAGKIPRRASVPSLLPVAGWESATIGLDIFHSTSCRMFHNPPEGVIVSANNRIADAAYPYYLSHFFDPPYRIRRIEQLLGRREKYSLGGLAALQLDHVSLHARDLICALQTELARIADDNRTVKAAANRLLAWDGACAVSSIEATIFHLMHQQLLRHLLVPVLGEEIYPAYVEILNQSIVPTDRIFAEAKSAWFSRRSRFELVTSRLAGCEKLEEKFGGEYGSSGVGAKYINCIWVMLSVGLTRSNLCSVSDLCQLRATG